MAGSLRYTQATSSLNARPVCRDQASIVVANHSGRPSASLESAWGSFLSACKALARPSEIPARRANWASV